MKKAAITAFFLSFITLQANAEYTIEQKLAISEVHECIYYWSFSSIISESSLQELNGFIHENCNDKLNHVDKVFPPVPKSDNGGETLKFSELYIDVFLEISYKKALQEHKHAYQRR
jgi:hypothetical protein